MKRHPQPPKGGFSWQVNGEAGKAGEKQETRAKRKKWGKNRSRQKFAHRFLLLALSGILLSIFIDKG